MSAVFDWFLFQQWRLLPYLATTYVFEHFHCAIFMDFVNIRIGLLTGDKSEYQVRNFTHSCSTDLLVNILAPHQGSLGSIL